MDIIQEASAFFAEIERRAREVDCYLRLVRDPSLSITNKIYTDIPLEEMGKYVPIAPEKKRVGNVNISLVNGLIRVVGNNGIFEDIPIFGNELW